jgi:hypothetical protein
MRNVGTKGTTGVKTTKKIWKETAIGISFQTYIDGYREKL